LHLRRIPIFYSIFYETTGKFSKMSYPENSVGMKMKIAIVGTGRLGAAFAFSLGFEPYVDELVLVDVIPKLAFAVGEDIYHGLALHGISIDISTYEDVTKIGDVDLIIITAGVARKPGMSRRDLVVKNFGIVGNIVKSVFPQNEDAWFLIVTNPVDAVSTYVSELTKSEKIIGVGTCLETARLRIYLAKNLNIPITHIEGYVGGEHGEEAVVLWSTVSINGISFKEFISRCDTHIDVEAAERYIKTISTEIIGVQGATIWGPVGAFIEIVRGIALNTGRILSLSIPHNFESIPIPIHVSIPIKIGRKLGPTLWNVLTWEEKDAIIRAARAIYETYVRGKKAEG